MAYIRTVLELWRASGQELVIVSLPIFHGFDGKFLSRSSGVSVKRGGPE